MYHYLKYSFFVSIMRKDSNPSIIHKFNPYLKCTCYKFYKSLFQTNGNDQYTFNIKVRRGWHLCLSVLKMYNVNLKWKLLYRPYTHIYTYKNKVVDSINFINNKDLPQSLCSLFLFCDIKGHIVCPRRKWWLETHHLESWLTYLIS